MVWIREKIGLVILLTGVKDQGSISRTFLEQFAPVGNQYILQGFAYDVSTGQKKPNNQNDFASEGKQSWLLQFACQPQLISSGLRRNNIVHHTWYKNARKCYPMKGRLLLSFSISLIRLYFKCESYEPSCKIGGINHFSIVTTTALSRSQMKNGFKTRWDKWDTSDK